MCCRAPFACILALAQWTMVGLTIWRHIVDPGYDIAWILGTVAVWFVAILNVFATQNYLGRIATPQQVVTIINRLRAKSPAAPVLYGRTYHHFSSTYIDTEGTVQTTSGTVASYTERRSCLVTITDITNVPPPITVTQPNNRYVFLDINQCWTYTDATSASNHEHQRQMFTNQLAHRDAHTEVSTISDHKYSYIKNSTTVASSSKSRTKYCVVVNGLPPSTDWLCLWTILGLSWFYIEWLLRRTEHQSINIVKGFAFGESPIYQRQPSIRHPCDCRDCTTRPSV